MLTVTRLTASKDVYGADLHALNGLQAQLRLHGRGEGYARGTQQLSAMMSIPLLLCPLVAELYSTVHYLPLLPHCWPATHDTTAQCQEGRITG